MLSEAQDIRFSWKAPNPHISIFLEQSFGPAKEIRRLVNRIFNIYLAFDILPAELAEPLLSQLKEKAQIPNIVFFEDALPVSNIAKIVSVYRTPNGRADQVLIRANLRWLSASPNGI